MKQIYLILSIIILAVSCSKIDSLLNNDSFLKFSAGQSATLTVGCEASSQTVMFSTSDSWEITSQETWVSISPSTGGSGEQSIALSFDANTGYDNRDAVITITSGTLSKTISVTQSQRNEMIIGETSYEMGSEGGTLRIPVSSNIKYSAEIISGSDWLTVSDTQTKAIEEYFLVITASPNPEYDNRTGTIKVSGASKESEITITQSHLEGLVIEKLEYDICKNGTDLSIPVRLNAGCVVEILGEASGWITVTSDIVTKGLSESQVDLCITPNEENDERYGEVKISAGSQEIILKIFQSGHYEQVGVDLGLPSGTLWATCNVGAANPTDWGNHYAWADVETKEEYSHATMKYYDPITGECLKYFGDAFNGIPSEKMVLDPEDDAATFNWGERWHTPTQSQWEELIDESNTVWTWTSMTNAAGESVNGSIVKSRINDNWIFLPAAGVKHDWGHGCLNNSGYYWSSSLYGGGYYDLVCGIYIEAEKTGKCGSYERFWGKSIRPVRQNR